MGYRYGKDDVKFVVSKIKAGIKQKDVNSLYHLWRAAKGTETKKGDYTNFISKLSPGSKHLDETTTTAYEHSDKYSVIRNIMHCLGCNEEEAKRVYRDRVIPVCVSRFHDPSNASMVSVRYHPAPCNDYLYFVFTSEDYAETFDLNPDLQDDLWTVRTDHEFKEILRGELTKSDIEEELRIMADNEYIPILVNVCVVKI